MTGSPHDVAPGWICRIRLGGGGIVYSSARHTKDTALGIAHTFERTVDYACDPGGPTFVEFPAENGPVKVCASRVASIEAVPVGGHRYTGTWNETRPAREPLTRR